MQAEDNQPKQAQKRTRHQYKPAFSGDCDGDKDKDREV